MSQHARIEGDVEYRIGDGPVMNIPPGQSIEVDFSEHDVTLSWSEGEARQSTAMPRPQFARYLAEKAIVPARE